MIWCKGSEDDVIRLPEHVSAEQAGRKRSTLLLVPDGMEDLQLVRKGIRCPGAVTSLCVQDPCLFLVTACSQWQTAYSLAASGVKGCKKSKRSKSYGLPLYLFIILASVVHLQRYNPPIRGYFHSLSCIQAVLGLLNADHPSNIHHPPLSFVKQTRTKAP